MKKIFIFMLLSLFLSIQVSAEEQIDLLERFKTHREAIYVTLNLTDEQILEINSIDEKVYKELEPQLKEISLNISRIQELADSEDCTIKKVNAVKKDFKSIEKRISFIKKEYNKEFDRVLNSEQKAAYKIAKKKQYLETKKEIENLKSTLKNS